MQIHSPYKGQLRRTYYDGLSMHFKLNEKQFELGAKLGHMQVVTFLGNNYLMLHVMLQVDNQLPFSVYPQVLYPLPPPPTVASTCGMCTVYLDRRVGLMGEYAMCYHCVHSCIIVQMLNSTC